jgi:hypothetical protein
MTIDGDVLEIDLDIDIDEVKELKEFVSTRLEYIEEIQVGNATNPFLTSSLLQLLFSMKKTKPSLKIPILDAPLTLDTYGKLHWVKDG